jgi:hypothetical protein
MQRRTERRAGPRRLISGHFPACAAGWQASRGVAKLTGRSHTRRSPLPAAPCLRTATGLPTASDHGETPPWKKSPQGLARDRSARSRGGG